MAQATGGTETMGRTPLEVEPFCGARAVVGGCTWCGACGRRLSGAAGGRCGSTELAARRRRDGRRAHWKARLGSADGRSRQPRRQSRPVVRVQVHRGSVPGGRQGRRADCGVRRSRADRPAVRDPGAGARQCAGPSYRTRSGVARVRRGSGARDRSRVGPHPFGATDGGGAVVLANSHVQSYAPRGGGDAEGA